MAIGNFCLTPQQAFGSRESLPCMVQEAGEAQVRSCCQNRRLTCCMSSAPTLLRRAFTCELQSEGFVTIAIRNASSTPSCTWKRICSSQLQYVRGS